MKWKSLNPYDFLRAMSPVPRTEVHGTLQARILEAVPFSRGFSQPRDRTQVSCIAGELFTNWAAREAPEVSSSQWKNKAFYGDWLLKAVGERGKQAL